MKTKNILNLLPMLFIALVLSTHAYAYTPVKHPTQQGVYYPSGISPKHPTPVVFFLQGVSNFKDHELSTYKHSYDNLLKFIASQGYTVVFTNQYKSFKDIDKFMKKEAAYLDTSRIGIVGHSVGGGAAFKVLLEAKKREWGNKGRFIFSIEPWFAADVKPKEIRDLRNTNVVIQQYGIGGINGGNDVSGKVPLSQYYLLDSIPDKNKDYQVFNEGGIGHGYPYHTVSEMPHLVDSLKALMAYTFTGSNNESLRVKALEIGTDDPYTTYKQILSDKKCSNDWKNIDYCMNFMPTLPSNHIVRRHINLDDIIYYKISAKSGQTLNVVLDGLSGDADLYVKKGSLPTKEDYYAKSTHGGTNNDQVEVVVAEDTVLYIGVYGFRAADYSLTSTIHGNITVTNIKPKQITKNSAKISWDVSKYATGQVEYGETDEYGNFNTKETSFKYKHHEQLLRNLDPGTTYHYRVISEDKDGQEVVSGDYTFKTLSTLPVVTNVKPKQITKNSAKISWDVSKYATGQVEYGETDEYGNFNTKETSFKYKHHEQLLRNLDLGTTYHYRVISEDENGQEVVSEDHTFTTLFDVKHYPPTRTLVARVMDDTVLRPTVNNPTNDNVYHTKIQMVNKSDTYISAYPKIQKWNSDMSLINIGNRLYNADTLEETDITKGKTRTEAYRTLCSKASSYFRWSNKVSNKFFVINSSYQFMQGEITGNNVNCSELDRFEDYEVVHMGPHEGNIDNNDRYVVFVAKKAKDTRFYVILYDIQKPKHRVWTKIMPNQQWKRVTNDHNKSSWQPSTLDWLSVSQSGKYIVLNNHAGNGNAEGMYRYDINFTNGIKLKFKDKNGNIRSLGSHGDMGYDTDGNEVYVQMSKNGVYSFNLDKPTELGKVLLHSPYGGGHISCRNIKRRGWCYVTANADKQGRGLQDVFALKIDGTGDENVQHFSQTHLNYNYDEAYGSPSPDGTKVIFNSHWGDSKIGTFVAEAQ